MTRSVAVLGATGRTGRPLLQRLKQDGHDVSALVRDPAKLGAAADGVRVVPGDSTDETAVADLVAGADLVISALGPTNREPDLHTATARVLCQVMPRHGVTRFVGVSGAGIDVPGDQKGLRDRLISTMIRTFGRDLARDKAAEYEVFAGSELDWTLVRPPMLRDGQATGHIGSDAHRPGKSSIQRADLADFLVDTALSGAYSRQAPFVWNT